MSLKELILPKDYMSILDIKDTEIAIKIVKDTFERELAKRLKLIRVSAPLFVRPETGLNDNLSGIERPVEFDILELGANVQIVQSLAKWKRMALQRYNFGADHGLYTDMNAIRRDEDLDNLHSVYVDQWDWEKVITEETRNIETLKETVRAIMLALSDTQKILAKSYPQLPNNIPTDIHFITTQELEDMYPSLSPKDREHEICKQYGAVFVMQIGDKLKSGRPHDMRSPDYDDWSLNGDILVWYPLLGRSVEISSMGIRVSPEVLDAQLTKAHCDDRRKLLFHSLLLNNELPLTMGGGIGQSRLCMLLLHKAHIGEVQATVWTDKMVDACAKNGIYLL